VLALPHVASGKVRDIYEVDRDRLLFVASDRISAYDVVLPDLIPDKGKVLTGLSLHWFEFLDTPNHFITTDLSGIVDDATDLQGRAMIVRRADVIPMECVVRGYLYGSAWREYDAGGGPTTEHLPSGLQMGEQLPQPLFTPATKAETGHDENLTVAGARALVGDDTYEQLKGAAVGIYQKAAEATSAKGVLLADTKFEFGWVDGELMLVDEVLTPDSSRYWPADRYGLGRPMPSFDKQYVRDWLDSTGWDHTPPAPPMPDDVMAATRARYVEAFNRITGRSFDDYLAAP
jgi:phosphoribosylaminoimidazole-succinocarboxamide synthase